MKECTMFICHCKEIILDAMRMIDKNAYGFLYVVDDNDSLVGCLTDGNIRRWIINGGSLDAFVSCAMNPNPIYVTEDRRKDGMRIMREQQISTIAVVDVDGHIVDVLVAHPKTKSQINNTLSNTPVVVMAGGKGTRLYPYTKILPKPLIPVGDIPILERIFERFCEYGVMKFYLTINYRKEMIKSYFAELSSKYEISYIEEETPLGTAGSIRLINEIFNSPIIVTNCDILIEADYSDVMKHHINTGNDLTIVSSLKSTVIPYGVLRTTKDGLITSVEEKPELSHFVNTGMYILNPDYVDWIPEGTPSDMTDLISTMLQKSRRVGMYPISENSFLDMGEFSEMKRMEEQLAHNFL